MNHNLWKTFWRAYPLIYKPVWRENLLLSFVDIFHGMSFAVLVILTQRFFDSISACVGGTGSRNTVILTAVILITCQVISQLLNGFVNFYADVVREKGYGRICVMIQKKISKMRPVDFERNSFLTDINMADEGAKEACAMVDTANSILTFYVPYFALMGIYMYRLDFRLIVTVFLIFLPVKLMQILKVLRNTFAMSGLSLLFSWFPMIFAVFLNEIKCVPFKKFVQTVTTLPNFISWVLVYSIAYCLLNSTGVVNSVLMNLGIIDSPQLFLQSEEHVWFKMWVWLTWKNAGWSAIMYIAAITGIDGELIEAAKVDGATRMQIIRHITIPSILPTYFVLVMLSLANFLSNGMEQYFVFENAFNKESIQVLDLYVYNLAMGNGGYSLSTAISILKSVVSVLLLCCTNGISKLIRGEGFI